jgi:LysR family glycine cleavage system transcriptional activator
MNNVKRQLPPLDTLVFFEAAARHMKFSVASRELFVSQAAVSKRIKQLEGWIGTQLFMRQGRNLVLTEEGAILLEKVSMTLEYIELAIRPIVKRYPESVSLSANSAVSMFWLMPKLKLFGLSEASCEVRLSTADQPAAQLTVETDLAIIYCDGHLTGWHCLPLLGGHLAPVVTPDYLQKLQLQDAHNLSQIFAKPEVVLLSYKRHGPESINWETWLHRTGYDSNLNPNIQLCRTYSHSIGSALAYGGIALGCIHLLHAEIESGQLIVLGNKPLTTPRDYYLCRPEDKIQSIQASQLEAFLLESVSSNKANPAS